MHLKNRILIYYSDKYSNIYSNTLQPLTRYLLTNCLPLFGVNEYGFFSETMAALPDSWLFLADLPAWTSVSPLCDLCSARESPQLIKHGLTHRCMNHSTCDFLAMALYML